MQCPSQKRVLLMSDIFWAIHLGFPLSCPDWTPNDRLCALVKALIFRPYVNLLTSHCPRIRIVAEACKSGASHIIGRTAPQTIVGMRMLVESDGNSGARAVGDGSLLTSLRSVSEAIRRRTPADSVESRCVEALLILGLEGSRDESFTVARSAIQS